MQISRFTTTFKDGKWEYGPMLYGHGLANILLYLLEPFRDGWTLFGLIHSEEEYLGAQVEEFSLISVFGSREELQTHSDEVERGKLQIAAGKTAIVLFYGTDNSSVMRRMTQEEYEKLELLTFRQEKDDLYYNS